MPYAISSRFRNRDEADKSSRSPKKFRIHSALGRHAYELWRPVKVKVLQAHQSHPVGSLQVKTADRPLIGSRGTKYARRARAALAVKANAALFRSYREKTQRRIQGAFVCIGGTSGRIWRA